MSVLLGIFLLVGAAPDTLELSLNQALRLALRTSPVRAEVQASRTQSASTLARGVTGLIPTVSASLGYAKADYGGVLPETLASGWGWTGTLTLSQVVFDPSVFAALAGSVVYSGYYSTDARDRQARLIYDVTADYLGLVKARLLTDAAEAALRRARENLRVVEEKERLGAASRIDLMRSQAFQAQAEMELLSARKALRVAAEVFKATVNVGPETAVRPTEEPTEPSALEISRPDSLLAEIRRRNPGLRMAAKAAAASRINCAAAIGKALPSVSAYWTSNYSDTLLPSSPARWRGHDQTSYGLRLSLPLLDLKSYLLGVVDAANEARRARAAGRLAELRLNSTAAAAVFGYQETREAYEYARRNLRLNQELDNLAREQHRLGAISVADLASVEAGLAQAQAAYIGALCETYVQAAQIGYLLGRTDITLSEKENR